MEKNESKMTIGRRQSGIARESRRPVSGLKAFSLFLLTVSSAAASSVESLTEFEPAVRTSTHGKVSQVQFSTNLIDLKAESLVQAPEGAVKRFRFGERVWVIGFRTQVFDPSGKPSRENYLCHTFISNQTPDERPLAHSGHGHQMSAIYSDAFTQEVRLPDGFGLLIESGEGLNWAPLFNNRQVTPARVRMSITVTLIREKDVAKPLRRLYSTLQSVKVPHLFFVPPGRHQRQSTFDLMFDGKIHFMGTHVHPHAESVDLFSVSRQEKVWKAQRKNSSEGQMVGMDVYSNPEGYPVRFGESYRITSTYNNPTDHDIDAMAGLFIFYSLEE
jgi:hypothetical protein